MKSKKRLFALRSNKGEIYREGKKPLYFSCKATAKGKRKRLNGIHDTNGEIFTFTITYGPDHRKFNVPAKSHQGTKGHKSGARV